MSNHVSNRKLTNTYQSVVSGGILFLKYKLRAKQSVFETKPDTENPPQHRNLAFVTGEVGGGKGAEGGEGTGGAGHQLEKFGGLEKARSL